MLALVVSAAKIVKAAKAVTSAKGAKAAPIATTAMPVTSARPAKAVTSAKVANAALSANVVKAVKPAKAAPTIASLTPAEVARARRVGHLLVGARPRDPAQAVAALVAMQAQDHAGALWSIGARTEGATEASIEDALGRGAIVRAWPLRRTLHVVAAADLRWLLDLLAPRSIAATLPRARAFGIEPAQLATATKALTAALTGGHRLERDQAVTCLDRAGVATEGQRGYHILVRLALEGVVCLGPRAGTQQTFVLVDEWLPKRAAARPREQALTELATRFFTGHGPATQADLIGWAALTAGDARAGIAGAGRALTRVDVLGVPHWMAADLDIPPPRPADVDLLAGFDELVLGYKQRGAFLDPAHADRIVPGGNGVFRPTVVVDGRVVGTWARASRARADVVTVTPFAPLPAAIRPGLAAAITRLAAFLGRPVELVIAS